MNSDNTNNIKDVDLWNEKYPILQRNCNNVTVQLSLWLTSDILDPLLAAVWGQTRTIYYENVKYVYILQRNALDFFQSFSLIRKMIVPIVCTTWFSRAMCKYCDTQVLDNTDLRWRLVLDIEVVANWVRYFIDACLWLRIGVDILFFLQVYGSLQTSRTRRSIGSDTN